MSTFGAKHLPFSAIINRFNVVTHIVILPAKLSGISIRIGHFLAVSSSEYHVAAEQGNFSPKWIENEIRQKWTRNVWQSGVLLAAIRIIILPRITGGRDSCLHDHYGQGSLLQRRYFGRDKAAQERRPI